MFYRLGMFWDVFIGQGASLARYSLLAGSRSPKRKLLMMHFLTKEKAVPLIKHN